jgi:type 1 glutamine amidotransferase
MLFAILVTPALLMPLATGSGHDKPPVTSAQPAVKPIKALLVIGGCCHDYKNQKDILIKGLRARANVDVTLAYDTDTTKKHLNPIYNNPDWAKGFDLIIHDECSGDVKDIAAINRILEPHRAGLPAVVLHCAMHAYKSEGFPKVVTPWCEFTGLVSTGHGAQLPIDVTFVEGASPITKGLENWRTIKEELYNNATGSLLDTARPLTRGQQGKADATITWINTYNQKCRVFCTTLGHNNETVADDRYLTLVSRGLLWAAGHLADDGKPAQGYGPAK